VNPLHCKILGTLMRKHCLCSLLLLWM